MRPLIEEHREIPAGAVATIAGVLELAHALDLVDDHGDRAVMLVDIRTYTTGHDRWTAARYVLPSHPSFAVLHRMLDGLIAQHDLIWTKAGWFTPADLRALECRKETHDGQLLIVFPNAYPWRIKPDENGNGGIRDDARFRAKDQRSFRRAEFGVKINPHDTDEPTPPSIWE